jgi:hypothetical protein
LAVDVDVAVWGVGDGPLLCRIAEKKGGEAGGRATFAAGLSPQKDENKALVSR